MVSIIIPNYNNCKYLYNCLLSIEEQDYKDIEVIVVDDGSDDNSLDIINSFKKKSKYKYFVLQQFNQNGSVARNRGIEIASGDYLYFLDSDDELFNQHVIETLVLEIMDYDLLITNYEVVDEKGCRLFDYINDNYYLNYEDNYKYVNLSPVPSNKLFRKKLIQDYNIYFSNVRIGQDLNFYLKYLSVCKNIRVFNMTSYKYRIVAVGMTRSINLNLLDIFMVFEDVRKFYKKNNIDLYFNKYVVNVALEHFHQQFSKIRKVKSKKLKKAMISYFDYCINNYSSFAINKDYFYKKQRKMFFIKKFLIIFRCYDFFLKVGKKNGL